MKLGGRGGGRGVKLGGREGEVGSKRAREFEEIKSEGIGTVFAGIHLTCS